MVFVVSYVYVTLPVQGNTPRCVEPGIVVAEAAPPGLEFPVLGELLHTVVTAIDDEQVVLRVDDNSRWAA